MDQLIINKNIYQGKKISNSQYLLNDKTHHLDIIENKDGYHIIFQGKSIKITDIISINDHILQFKINNKNTKVEIKNELHQVLEKMGLGKNTSQNIKELKAPMPGMVLKILITNGQEVKKNDPLLILEAMKMENIIKSPQDGTISEVIVNTGNKINKNDILLRF